MVSIAIVQIVGSTQGPVSVTIVSERGAIGCESDWTVYRIWKPARGGSLPNRGYHSNPLSFHHNSTQSTMYLKTFVQQVRIVTPRRAPAAALARTYSMIPSTPHVSASSPATGNSDMYATKAEHEEVHSTVYVSGDHHTADIEAPFTPSVNHVFDD
ncbi:hypothetical protein INT44_006280 [Umbelopsis vinacea]|uniref:Uncharacterized protein n=1 Tax=Umbelopsis vinacea TaxID=44442 RepID=A0A8H7PTX5_9FUNG|nr:hypothetical protein INT44_006280 [Umbelopsis vinacea]